MSKAKPVFRYGVHRSKIDFGTAFPLESPLSLMIDPSSGCNFGCHFCPTGQGAHKDIARRTIKLDLFEKIVHDIGDFERPLKVLHLYKEGEPLINKHFPELVRIAVENGVATSVETTTNASLLTPERSEAIIRSGLNAIRFSIYGTDDDSLQKNIRRKQSFDEIRKNVTEFYNLKEKINPDLHVHAKMLHVEMTEDQITSFVDVFSPIADSYHVEPIQGQSLSIGDFKVEKNVGRKACSEPFVKMAVRPDGIVTACCGFFGKDDIVVGDANTERLIDIWNGEPMNDLRMKMVTDRRSEIPQCATCAYVEWLPNDHDFDHAMHDIEGRLRKRSVSKI